MHRQRSAGSISPFRGDPLWEPESVVELPLLVTGQTAEHLESLASRKGLTLGSFIRVLLDESLAREYPDGVPVPLALVSMGGEADSACRVGQGWGDERPSE